MSRRLNEILYISEWRNCDFHKEEPELTLVHEQEYVEIFPGTKDTLEKLSLYKDS